MGRVEIMSLDFSVMATIIMLVPLFYLLLASPAFLFVRLDIPQVAYIFRAVFFGYFLVLVSIGLVAAMLFALDGRPVAALCIGLLAAFDLTWRGWMMPRLTALLADVEAARAGVGHRLRRFHLGAMAMNAVQAATVLAFVPVLAAGG